MSLLPRAIGRFYNRLSFSRCQSPITHRITTSINRRYPNRYSFATSASASVSDPVSSSASDDLIVSDRAVERLKKIASSGEYLRVLVDSGGCSGFEYKFQLVSAPESDDRIFEKDGVRVVVDNLSLDFLRGATIDYQVELIKAAFRIVKNPKAEKGCSCGTSFALKATPTVAKVENEKKTS